MFSQVDGNFGQRVAEGLRNATFTDHMIHFILEKKQPKSWTVYLMEEKVK